jgi:hypothetical protein
MNQYRKTYNSKYNPIFKNIVTEVANRIKNEPWAPTYYCSINHNTTYSYPAYIR